jgi:predicted small integral membrane protein
MRNGARATAYRSVTEPLQSASWLRMVPALPDFRRSTRVMQSPFLAFSIGAMVLGVAILAFAVTRLVGLLRASVVARLPAVAEQVVAFDRPGTFILHLEGPRFSTALRRATFSLRDAASGREVRSWRILFRTTTSGVSTVRLSVRGFAVERAGRYALSIAGIAPDNVTERHAVVFTRPYAAAMVLLILGTILGGFCVIGGLVFTILQLTGSI